jgi:translation initiation factor 2B subunit (eIF-2B alpha/beta/delta family)
MIEKMQVTYGEYFDISDYPPTDRIADHFQFEVQYMPVADPTAFELGQFAEDQRKELTDQLNRAVARAADKATREYVKRLREQLQHVSGQLRHGKRLHGSLLSNLTDLLDANLNVTDSPELADVLANSKDAVNSVATALESKESIDKDIAARRAEEIDRKLAGIF